MGKTTPIADRFNAKVIKTNSCWLWTGALYRGYGHLWVSGKQLKAHRVSWLLATGVFPERDIFVCHKCDVRNCVNPEHLFLGTHSDNMVDSVNKKRHRNSRKTHCKSGHILNEENTYIENDYIRHCKVCDKIRQRKYRAQKRSQ